MCWPKGQMWPKTGESLGNSFSKKDVSNSVVIN